MQLFGEKEDTLAWKTSQDGDFSIASAYKSAKTEDTNLQSFLGKWLWKLDTLPKIKHFCGFAFTTLSQLGKFLMPGASYATLAAHCAKTRKSPSSLYCMIAHLPWGSGIRL